MLERARQHHTANEVAQAERLYRKALALDAGNRAARENLVVLCLQSGRPDEAEKHLRRLLKNCPEEPLYCERLATLLERRDKGDEAITAYRRLLAARPGYNSSRYNLARLLKRQGLDEEALLEYQECLARSIEQPEEVHTNISVIQTGLQRHDAARQSLQAALVLNPGYLPALYNMALLVEEQGNWAEAKPLFLKILEREPYHGRALAHIANGDKILDPVDPVIRNMKRALRRDTTDPLGREDLLYALGKAHDDCKYFDKAFDYYQQANQCSQQRCGPYDAPALEQDIDQLINACDTRWLDSIEAVSQAPHIFICGMFRSGSTLMEQILAAHPSITAGGEIDYFQRSATAFPGSMLATQPEPLQQLGRGYEDYLSQHFPSGTAVSNKRPDNFLYLGLIKALFPNARIINTLRQPLDNCLSLFFQPLDKPQAYANDLLDAGHYYLQYLRLMDHWRQLFGANIVEVNYETLIQSPRDTIAGVLASLQLDWHEGCLQFHQLHNRVRTASVHQVRQPLYSSSSGRWQNYARHLQPLRDYLADTDYAK